MDNLDEYLRKQALDLGADFIGVADLSPAREYIERHGGTMLARFPRAVSIGVAMPFAIVDQLPRHREDKAAAVAYRTHSYSILNARLDQLASRLASVLQREGHNAFPVRASQPGPLADGEGLHAAFSHKLAAHLAGLGWIGKSCLLVTPQAGPRVRWASILTDAPLTPGQPMDERCGDCRVCVEACPPQVLTNRNFVPDEPRQARYDAHACNAYQRDSEDFVEVRVCGMCVYACPHGRKKQNAG
jgi:epoxyqueuosine reductase QueG